MGMESLSAISGMRNQQRPHELPVRGIQENRLAVVAALDDVVRVASEGEAGKAGHETVLGPFNCS